MFDYGDAQWAHAFELLFVPQAVVQLTAGTVDWEPIERAYRDVWIDLVGRTDFDALLAAAGLTHPVNRATTWLAALADCTPAELSEWAGGRSRTCFTYSITGPEPGPIPQAHARTLAVNNRYSQCRVNGTVATA